MKKIILFLILNFSICFSHEGNSNSSELTADVVRQCYRTFLGREPESEEVVHHKLSQHSSFVTLKQDFLNSEEYQKKIPAGDVVHPHFFEDITLKDFELISKPGIMDIILDNYLLSFKYYEICHEIGNLGTYGPCGLPHDQAIRKQHGIFKNSLTAFLKGDKINKIPHTHHRTWITSTDNPHECPPHIVEKYLNSLKNFNLDENWTHHFWCIDPALIPGTIALLNTSEIPIAIHSLTDFITYTTTHVIVEKLINHNHYTFAKNLIAFEIVNTFGGIHFDMGFEVKEDFAALLDRFDYLFYYQKYPNTNKIAFFDITFFAAQPNSPLISKYLDIVSGLPTFPKNVRISFSKNNVYKIIGMPVFLSLSASEFQENDTILYLNSPVYFDLIRQGSWSNHEQGCKFGNKDIYYSDIEW
jgi:hypothetical protein